jgi:hypothetical protein
MARSTTFVTAALLLIGSAAFAQQQTSAATFTDARWQPWVGCWQLRDERVRDDGMFARDPVASATSPARRERSASDTRVCVTPAGGGVSLSTLVDNQKVLEDTIVADGASYPMRDADCRGSKRSEWSKNGRRVFTTAEISCNDQAPRKVSGLTMMLAGPTWVDIQVIDIQGRKNIRVRKFYSRDAKPTRVGDAWSVADVKEASAKLMPEAVQAALVELGTGFNVKGKQLAELADAGVATSVIDLMIALSYPKHFVVEHSVSSGAAPYSFSGGDDYGDFLGGAWPWIADAAFWPAYYSPFAYRYWGHYDPFYVPNSGYVVVEPPHGNSEQPVASGTGRVVDGRGYTRVTTREPQPVPRTGSSDGGSGTYSGTSSNGSNGGSVSTGGYSNGGSGGGGSDGGRTAVPRPPGGTDN